jgi:hypothetical protein
VYFRLISDGVVAARLVRWLQTGARLIQHEHDQAFVVAAVGGVMTLLGEDVSWHACSGEE